MVFWQGSLVLCGSNLLRLLCHQDFRQRLEVLLPTRKPLQGLGLLFCLQRFLAPAAARGGAVFPPNKSPNDLFTILRTKRAQDDNVDHETTKRTELEYEMGDSSHDDDDANDILI